MSRYFILRGLRFMSRRTLYVVVSGISLLLFSVVCTLGSAAEFRTSVRGKSLVRPAGYQEPVEQYPAPDLPTLDPLAGGPGDCTTPCWDGNCSVGCDPCSVGWSYWGSFEFLLWWRQGQGLPPLVTSSPTTVAPTEAGVLGFPSTQILYPTEVQGGDARPGGRLTFGAWFDACQFSGAVRGFTRWEKAQHTMISTVT